MATKWKYSEKISYSGIEPYLSYSSFFISPCEQHPILVVVVLNIKAEFESHLILVMVVLNIKA